MYESLTKEMNKAYKDLMLDWLLTIVVIVSGVISLRRIEFMSDMFIIVGVIILIMLSGCFTLIICDNQIIDETKLKIDGLKKSKEET